MNARRSKKSPPLIYVIGDSHVGALSGRNAIQESFPIEIGDGVPGIRTIRLKPHVLAYNLVSLDTRNKSSPGRPFNVLRLLPPRTRSSFSGSGEIDSIRAHRHDQTEPTLRNRFPKSSESVSPAVLPASSKQSKLLTSAWESSPPLPLP